MRQFYYKMWRLLQITLFNLIEGRGGGGGGQYQFLGRIATHLPYFYLLKLPSQMTK